MVLWLTLSPHSDNVPGWACGVCMLSPTFCPTGSGLVSDKPSAAARVSPGAPTKAWNSSPLATFKLRPVCTRPVGWRPPCPLSSRLGMICSPLCFRPLMVQVLVELPLGHDLKALPWTSRPMGHHHAASPKRFQRHPVSTPVAICRIRRPTHGVCRTAGSECFHALTMLRM